MFKKISRQECLRKFSVFPLREWDKKKKEYVFYYPDIESFYRLKLHAATNIQLKKKIAAETVKLYKELGINELTFLCDYDTSWITKNSKHRTDYKQLVKAVKYLRDNKVSLKFNGGIVIEITYLREFLEHLYILTMCDPFFSYYHFLDDKENFIGYIHYDGELRIDTLNKRADEQFLKAIKKTTFKDAMQEQSNRI
ncbi:MAG: hypothetical protein SFU21_12015 [Flavihumibacter sp.]|nr:hypothetical protein [Flavihumibacter sp.]